MRNDLDTARGILWWAVLPLLLLVVSVSVAHAQAVVSCTNAALAGAVAPSCAGGSVVEVDAAELLSSDLVAWCAVPAGDGSDCSYAAWIPAGALSNLDAVFVADTEAFAVAGTLPGFPILGFFAEEYGLVAGGTGGEGGGSGDDWTLEDLDLAEAAQGFSVAFMIVALFWGLGKGVGVIIHAIKRF